MSKIFRSPFRNWPDRRRPSMGRCSRDLSDLRQPRCHLRDRCRAVRRAAVRCPSRGAADVLRHSIASSMLRQRASLHKIAGVLRHRTIATTEIHPKVDVVALGEIAQRWEEVTPC